MPFSWHNHSTVAFLDTIKARIGPKRQWLMPFLWVGVVGIIFILLYLIYLRTTLPDPETLVTRAVKESTKVYDRTGQVLLYDIYEGEKRTIVPWSDIPQTLKDATVAAEDNNFYQHRGVDFRGIIRALLRDIQSTSFSEGGSTITQQLVKNALLTNEKAVSRKIKEAMLSIEIERKFSKDEILWMYLNQIPYGSTAYGVEAASHLYFGKSAHDLDLNESAIIASIARAPSYYSPYGKHVDELIARHNFVLKRMRDLGYISDREYQDAINEKIVFKDQENKLIAPHFVLMARDELIKKYGEDRVSNGGFKIITTLDADLQKKAEELVAKYAAINKQRYKATNASLVAIDPKTGDVLALVGSADYFDTANEGNFNVATAQRQPGSSFKPFAYATAFAKGYTDSTILLDTRTEFNPRCSPEGTQLRDRYGSQCYHPLNYDLKYHGAVTMRQALQNSLNVPSVETLYLASIDDTVATARKMGITTLKDSSQYGLALVLGGAEVRLVDITSAYGVFGNDGIRNPWELIQRVELGDGSVLDEKKDDPQRVLDPQVARLMSDVLSDNNARIPEFGPNSALYFPGYQIAAKTGTTQDNRDGWVIGYSTGIAVGVWTGNNNNSSMTRVGAGISAAGPLWHAFMAEAIKKIPPDHFIPPDPVHIDKIMLNGNYVYNGEIHTILYYVDRNNPRGAFPSNPAGDPQFPNWEWAAQHSFQYIPPQPAPTLGVTPLPTPLPSP